MYHASAPDGSSLAVKVYKTSILVFKDRERCDPDAMLVWLGFGSRAVTAHIHWFPSVICCMVPRQQTPPACRYVKGDFRFRKGYSKSNPRKMVKLWAEKEMRNLIRLREAGIRCPTAHQLQMHVLVMGFIGSGDVAAPRLKDADLPLVRCPAACRVVAAPACASIAARPPTPWRAVCLT